ncbi:RDD family protein [Dyella tabacisoli]|uniref:RDD family protein n=1 Tax=Dyella tabacisoli TaxID=2282381 RepID=A0A369UL57_9GAMM|nr:RDD family protein [Dyella tabacisoli]RDD80458.1 RDD family protein [Dyella tabacisoli]
MDVNPYAAPQAVVEDVEGFSARDIEARKASRGRRLGAALLDGLLLGIGVTILLFAVVPYAATSNISAGGLVTGLLLLAGIAVANCVLLHRNGQTIGKLILGIKVVRTDGSRIGLGRIIGLRIVPISLLGGVPYLGGLIHLVDSLMIFGAERRCLHDVFADTVVINA